MATRSRKRLRDATAEPPVAAIRSMLASRAAQFPRRWRCESTAASGPTTNEFLCGLGRSVTEAMESLPASAEMARRKLREMRSTMHAAIDARFDELELDINVAVTGKAATLERELVTVDAALELWRSVSSSVNLAVAALSDSDFKAQHASLSSSLDTMEAQLQALPTAVMEPPLVHIAADTARMLAAIARFVTLVSPTSVSAADLRLEAVPKFAFPGVTMRLRVSLGVRHAFQSAEDLEVSLGRLVTMIVVDASLESLGSETRALVAAVSCDILSRGLVVTLRTPVAASRGDCVVIDAVHVAGQRIAAFPLRLSIIQGLRAPLKLEDLYAQSVTSSCISSDGQLFVPRGSKAGDVQVWDVTGASMPGLSLSAMGFHGVTRWSAHADGDAPTLLLADICNRASESYVVALDSLSRAVRWSVIPSGVKNCSGVVALPTQDAVVINSRGSGELHILSLANGARKGALAVPGAVLGLTADPVAGIVYCMHKRGASCDVAAWECFDNGQYLRLLERSSLALPGDPLFIAALAVMPAAPGKQTSHLIVGSVGAPELLILSLPGLTLVHTHRLEGMKVLGLAADPWGEALAVYDSVSRATHVLTWPPPGMQPIV